MTDAFERLAILAGVQLLKTCVCKVCWVTELRVGFW